MKELIDRIMARVESIGVSETDEYVMPGVFGCVRKILEEEITQSHEAKQLEVVRRFFKNAYGHVWASQSEEAFQLARAIETRDEFILVFGRFPDDDAIYARAAATYQSFDRTCLFAELSESIRGSWVRRAKLDSATFDSDLYRRLADATAKATVGRGLAEIAASMADGWVREAEVAILVPPRLWDPQYLVQNERGMRKMLSELQGDT